MLGVIDIILRLIWEIPTHILSPVTLFLWLTCLPASPKPSSSWPAVNGIMKKNRDLKNGTRVTLSPLLITWWQVSWPFQLQWFHGNNNILPVWRQEARQDGSCISTWCILYLLYLKLVPWINQMTLLWTQNLHTHTKRIKQRLELMRLCLYPLIFIWATWYFLGWWWGFYIIRWFLEVSPSWKVHNSIVFSEEFKINVKTNGPRMVRPLKTAVLLLSVHSLLDQCLLHLPPTHIPDLPTHLSPPQVVIALIKRVVRDMPYCWFPW